jgi:tetratricopeptide (TPR) repeat protein
VNPPRKLFLSFSSRDGALVQKLYHALANPAIAIWDYSSPLDALPPGADLARSLRERLAQTDDVLVLLSASSLDPLHGKWVQFEIEAALDLGFVERGRLVPIVVDRAHLLPWPPPYAALRGLTFIEMSTAEPQTFERAVSRLYLWLGVERAPATRADPRIPLTDRLRKELECHRDALTVYSYNEVIRLAERFEDAYQRADYGAALARIEALRYRLQDELPSSSLYYPDIVKGACELHLDRIFDAERTFRTLLDHPAADENAWGGLGLSLVRRQRHEEAVAAFQRAIEYSPSDSRARYNLALGKCLAGMHVSAKAIALDAAAFEPDERVEIICFLADVYRREGRPADAERLLRTLPPAAVHEVAAMQLAQAMVEQGRTDEAIAQLEERARIYPDFSAWHLLARLLLQIGDVRGALRIYEEKLSAPPFATRQTVVERARVLEALGRREKARELCRELLERSPFGLPTCPADFYWDGFANHLCGYRDRAEHDWSRSACFGPPYEGLEHRTC